MIDKSEIIEGYIYNPFGWINCQMLFINDPNFITQELTAFDQPIYKLRARIKVIDAKKDAWLSKISIDKGNAVTCLIPTSELNNEVIQIYDLKGLKLCDFSTSFSKLIPIMINNTEVIISGMTERIQYLKACIDVLQTREEVLYPKVKIMN